MKTPQKTKELKLLEMIMMQQQQYMMAMQQQRMNPMQMMNLMRQQQSQQPPGRSAPVEDQKFSFVQDAMSMEKKK